MSWLEERQESLGRGQLGETWFMQTADGRSLVSKRLRRPDGGAGELAASIRAVAGVRHPALVPIVEVAAEPEAVWVRSRMVPGVPLQRLLMIAVLTPPQAALIVRGILDGLGALNAAGLAHGDLHANNVHLGPIGEVWLSDAGLRPLLAPDAHADWSTADAASVAALVIAMAGDERRRGPLWRAPAAQDLLAAAEVGPEALRRRSLEALPDAGQERVARELGALVHAASLRSAPRPAPVVAAQLVPPPRRRIRIPQLSRRARRRALAGAAVVAIAATSLLVGWRLAGPHHRLPMRPLAAVQGLEEGASAEARPLPGRSMASSRVRTRGRETRRDALQVPPMSLDRGGDPEGGARPPLHAGGERPLAAVQALTPDREGRR